MIVIYRITILWLFCTMVLPVTAQQYRTVLPYRMVGGKMIVEMEMNGIPRSFIFDTGGRTALTGEICEELGLVVVDSLVATDVNSKKAAYPIVAIESLLTPDKKINFTNVTGNEITRTFSFRVFSGGRIDPAVFVGTYHRGD